MKESTLFKRSPYLLAPIENWYKYFDKMNEEQIHTIQLRLARLYKISQTTTERRKEQERALWELFSKQ